jgi:hypothetical protein
MDRNAYRDESDTGGRGHPDAYWRRRAIALAAGLGLLALLAWVFSGGGKPAAPAAKSSASMTPAAAYSAAQNGASPSASTAASAGTSRTAAADPTASGRPSPSVGASPKSSRSGSESGASPGAPTAAPTGDGALADGACAPGAVVLSLFGDKTDYQDREDPVFSVDVVSTASQPCSIGLGAKQLQLVVTSSGRVIWDSTDCAHGDASRTAELTRGVPVQQTMTWNRSVTLPGCVTLATSAPDGTYQVQARDGTVSSPVSTIQLVR